MLSVKLSWIMYPTNSSIAITSVTLDQLGSTRASVNPNAAARVSPTELMMLSPTLISMPFKLLLFVLVDGWALTMGSLAASFVR